jgi:hypothetical protein
MMADTILGELTFNTTNKGEPKTVKKNVIVVSLAAIFTFCDFVSADSIEKAKELIRVMEMTKQITTAQQQMEQFAEQMVNSQGLSEDDAKKAKDLAKKSITSSFEAVMQIDWESMFAEIYAEVFSEDEIQGLIDFYNSPCGKKLLKKQPELMAATLQKMRTEMSKIMPKIQADVAKAVEEAKK